MNKLSILVVEDDSSIKSLIVTTLNANGYRYIATPNGKGAVMYAASHNPDSFCLTLDCLIWTALR